MAWKEPPRRRRWSRWQLELFGAQHTGDFMKETIRKISNHRYTRTTVKYGIVSVIATVIDLVVLNGGIKMFGLAPQIAKTAAFLSATVSVFRLQQRWVFRADPEASTARQMVQYLAASIAGFLASQLAITISNHLWPGNLLYINVANLMGFGTVWLAKLVFFHYVVFKPPEHPMSAPEDSQRSQPGTVGSEVDKGSRESLDDSRAVGALQSS